MYDIFGIMGVMVRIATYAVVNVCALRSLGQDLVLNSRSTAAIHCTCRLSWCVRRGWRRLLRINFGGLEAVEDQRRRDGTLRNRTHRVLRDDTQRCCNRNSNSGRYSVSVVLCQLIYCSSVGRQLHGGWGRRNVNAHASQLHKNRSGNY